MSEGSDTPEAIADETAAYSASGEGLGTSMRCVSAWPAAEAGAEADEEEEVEAGAAAVVAAEAGRGKALRRQVVKIRLSI